MATVTRILHWPRKMEALLRICDGDWFATVKFRAAVGGLLYGVPFRGHRQCGNRSVHIQRCSGPDSMAVDADQSAVQLLTVEKRLDGWLLRQRLRLVEGKPPGSLDLII